MGDMDYEVFKRFITEKIRRFLPETYADSRIEVRQLNKNNGTILDALVVERAGETVHPVIYLDRFYADYKTGKNMEDVLGKIAELVRQKPEISIADVLDYEKIRHSIQPVMVNLKKNEAYLQDKPHQIVMDDLAVLYEFHMQGLPNGHVRVTNSLMDHYGITAEQLHQQAISNLVEVKAEFISMDDMLERILTSAMMKELGLGKDEAKAVASQQMEGVKRSGIFVLTNENCFHGAVQILNPQVKEMVAQKTGGDYYIIPSSIHEVIIVPKEEGLSWRELQEMVEDVNASTVAEEEQLSDSVYQYDAEKKELTRCNEGMEQTKDYRMSTPSGRK